MRTKFYRYLKIATLIDPRFKNHSNIFTIAEQIENKALLEAELLTQKNPDHPALIRNFSNSETRKNISNDDDAFGNFLMLNGSEMESTSKSQSSKIKEEIEAFLKV